MLGAGHIGIPDAGGSGGFTPRQLSGCTLWLRGDRGVTDAGGGNCSSWADSILGKAITAAGAARPTIVSASTHLGGKPCLAFSGTQWLKGSFATHATACTLFAVVWHNTAVGSTVGYCATTAGGVLNTRTSLFNSGGIFFRRDGSVDTAGPDAVNSISVGVGSAAAGDVYVNSRSVFTHSAAAATLAADDTFLVGALDDSATFGLGGEVAEVAAFNRILTAAEVAGLVTYASGRYGIAVT